MLPLSGSDTKPGAALARHLVRLLLRLRLQPGRVEPAFRCQ